ncbi:hypothetical protein, partial [Gillisia limnaea]|uniref:hypothetical protein n=1 Tax=Gillisia limnaea TaxID=195907 RepID=UPI0039EE6E69
ATSPTPGIKLQNYRKSSIENMVSFRYLSSDFGTCQRSDSETLNDFNRTSLKKGAFLCPLP